MSSIYASDSADDLFSLFSVVRLVTFLRPLSYNSVLQHCALFHTTLCSNITISSLHSPSEHARKLVCDVTRHTSAHFLLPFDVSFFFYIWCCCGWKTETCLPSSGLTFHYFVFWFRPILVSNPLQSNIGNGGHDFKWSVTFSHLNFLLIN